MKKCIVLYSGGLDSRLAVKIMQERGFEVEALHFALPFGCGCCNFNCNFKFTQLGGVKFSVLDVTKGNLLKEYLKILKKPKYGVGAGVNPCRDCKVFMFKKAKEYANEKGIEVIATGEVTGQRPMSQTSHAMKIIDEAIGFELVRPLIEVGAKGRNRKKQIELAQKYDITYPTPGGGCALCEKELAKRFRVLFDNNLINDATLPLSLVGRHFWIDGVWIIVARDEKECVVIENSSGFLPGEKGKPAVYFSKKKGEKNARKLQEVYGARDTKGIEKFGEFKL